MKNRLVIITLTFIFLASCGSSGGGGGGGKDEKSPVIKITSHSNETVIAGAPGTEVIEGTVSDDDAIDLVTLRVNGGSKILLKLVDGKFSEKLSFTEDGNQIVVTAFDESGNKATKKVEINYVAEGKLDKDFGTSSGYNFADYQGDHDQAVELAISDDGSIFVGGWGKKTDSARTADFIVWRYKSNGKLDTASGFGGGLGYAVLDNPGANVTKLDGDYGDGLTIDNNGNILLVGHANNDGDYDLVVSRFDPDTGDLDDSFGGDINPVDGTPDGFVMVDVTGGGSAENNVGSVVVDASDRIYVVGSSDDDLFVWRFTNDGELDSGFGLGNGYVSYDSGGVDTGHDIALDADGNLVVLGRANGEVLLWRMDKKGESDNSFGTNGIATASGAYAIGKMGFNRDGAILVVGTVAVGAGDTDMALWQFTSKGEIDEAFGADYDSNGVLDGYVLHGEAGGQGGDYDYGRALAVDAAGNIVVTGDSNANHGGSVKPDMVVWRFTAKGKLDKTFASPNGFFTHHSVAGQNNLDRGYDVAIDKVGRIVICGDTWDAGAEMAIWRFK